MRRSNLSAGKRLLRREEHPPRNDTKKISVNLISNLSKEKPFPRRKRFFHKSLSIVPFSPTAFIPTRQSGQSRQK